MSCKAVVPKIDPALIKTPEFGRLISPKNMYRALGTDFERKYQVEAVFEIPAINCVISGSIDLLQEYEEGNILREEIIDFKTMGLRRISLK